MTAHSKAVAIGRRLESWLVPDELRADPEAERRSRIALAAAVLGIALGLVYGIQFRLVLDGSIAALFSGLALGQVGICVLALASLRILRSLAAAVHLVLGYVLILFTAFIYVHGGAQVPALYWLALIPVVAVFTLSARAGLWTHLACQLVLGAFAALRLMGHEFPPGHAFTQGQTWFTSIAFLALSFFALMAVFHADNEGSLKTLRNSNAALRRSRSRAERAHRSKAEFLARVSHELRTPVDAILRFALLLTDRLGPSQSAHASAETIRRNARHLLSVIDDILDLSRTEVHELRVQREIVSPELLCREVVASLRSQADRAGVTLRERYDPDLPEPLFADGQRLEQILSNLVGNAIRFSDGGEVDVRVLVSGGEASSPRIRFEVRDSGPGLTAPQLERLFEPFAQPDPGTAQPYGGAHLGLSLSSRLCQLMSGVLDARSAPGEGSAFWVELPAGEIRRDCGKLAPSLEPALPHSGAVDPGLHELPRPKLWDLVVRYFVPSPLKEDPAEFRKAQIIVGSAVAPIPMLLLWAWVFNRVYDPQISGVFGALLAITAPALLGPPVLLKLSGSVKLAANAFCAWAYGLIGTLVYCTGGLTAPSSFWIVLLPLATPQLGIRGAGVWVGLSLGLYSAFAWMELSGSPPISWLRSEALPWMSIASASTLTALTTTLVTIYDRAHVGAIAEIGRSNRELAVAQSEAEQANRGKSEFLASVSHEIRTPMNAILGFSELLLEEWGDPRSARRLKQSVAIIHSHGAHLLALVDEMLELSRIEAGRIALEHTEFSPRALCFDVRGALSSAAEAKGLELRLEVEGPVAKRSVRGDPGRVRQVLWSLLEAAISRTAQGAIALRLSADEERLRFEVEDCATELVASERVRVHESFRGSSGHTGSGDERDAGLGLAVSRMLCELMGARTGAETTQSGGNRFWFALPDGRGSAKATGPPAAPQAQRLDYRVLLAEDGKDNQVLISHVLRKAGVEIEVAENGREAVEAVLRSEESGQCFDLVLMDLQMPVLDGFGAVRELRRLGHSLPIVALTAHAFEEERIRCLEVGCDDFACKPISRDTLLDLVRKWCAGSPKTVGA